MTELTCPHCGNRFVEERPVVFVDIGLGDGHATAFPPLPSGTERHIDHRYTCARAGCRAHWKDPDHAANHVQ